MIAEVVAGSLSVSTEVNSHLSLRGLMQLNTQNANQTPQVNEATTVARNDDRSGGESKSILALLFL